MNGQPQGPPVIDGIPCLSNLGQAWSYSFTEIGTADAGNGVEKLYLFRLFTSNTLSEVAGPRSYFQAMIDKMALDLSGLEIARDLPPSNGQRP